MLEWLTSLFKGPPPKTHDLTRIGRGAWRPENGGLQASTCWFSSYFPRLSVGDYVVLPHPEGGTTRYKVTRFWSPNDPGDQHFADLIFAPRKG